LWFSRVGTSNACAMRCFQFQHVQLRASLNLCADRNPSAAIASFERREEPVLNAAEDLRQSALLITATVASSQDKPHGVNSLYSPPFANCAKNGAPAFLGDVSEIKSLGHPPAISRVTSKERPVCPSFLSLFLPVSPARLPPNESTSFLLGAGRGQGRALRVSHLFLYIS